MVRNRLIPMIGTGRPVPGQALFCEIIKTGQRFIGIYDEDLVGFIDADDPDEVYPFETVIWYLDFDN